MNWKIRGNYKQKKREGYNLLNNNSQFFPTLPGLTFDFKEDGSIVCQGTSSATWNRKRNAGNIYNVESGTYTLYLKVIGSCPNAILSIALEDADMKTLTSSRIGVSNSSLIKVGTFTYDATTEIKYTSIVLEGFKTDSSYDCIFYPMLMKNTYTADVAYEQYGASPSLDYPSVIETTGSNANLFNKDDVAVKTFINNLGTTQFNESWDLGGFIDVRNIENITFSVKTDLTWSQVVIAQYNDSKEFIKKQQINNSTQGTIKLESNTRYVRFGYRNDCNLSEIKLEKGSVATPYSPYRNG